MYAGNAPRIFRVPSEHMLKRRPAYCQRGELIGSLVRMLYVKVASAGVQFIENQ